MGSADPVPYLREAHALVQTSKWEGLPRVALEAVAVGRPTVGFDVKGVQDIPGAYLAKDNDLQDMSMRVVGAASQGPRHLPPLESLSYRRSAASILSLRVQSACIASQEAGTMRREQARPPKDDRCVTIDHPSSPFNNVGVSDSAFASPPSV